MNKKLILGWCALALTHALMPNTDGAVLPPMATNSLVVAGAPAVSVPMTNPSLPAEPTAPVAMSVPAAPMAPVAPAAPAAPMVSMPAAPSIIQPAPAMVTPAPVAPVIPAAPAVQPAPVITPAPVAPISMAAPAMPASPASDTKQINDVVFADLQKLTTEDLVPFAALPKTVDYQELMSKSKGLKEKLEAFERKAEAEKAK